MKTILTLLFILVLSPLAAQDTPDTIGSIKIQPIFHGSLVISYDNAVIYVDPYGDIEKFAQQPKPTIILITDIHGDHLNMETLEALDTSSAQFIVPKAVAEKLPEKYTSRVITVSNGKNILVKDNINIHTIPMYNLPESEDSRHPKGRGNGYILTLGNQNVYISGDTSGIPEMRDLRNIDIAFICMNLPYTMDIHEAAEAVLDFKPKVIYPYHYRGSNGLSDIEEFKNLISKSSNTIEVRLKEWYR
ncbi:MBL fold metallo-hydrolase [Imtechella halotolerans]|uniref:Metallo-hydrolase/oxidoreductase n=1 Tax=Imtechella halotolerans K1 TaxID=946077 RepID=I0W8I4_9FLAO|nr:MBL fold metallo-hydrolase [Imtechella halotolerans]EID72700.1 metallo-hydrolase/oxidoreductase [Imtechella halotolerans K1]WMQ64622.1 MBL fold metallo-hydrolase [Imtechella halotolerans]